MKWVKTYESFIIEAINPTEEVAKFEKLIDLPSGIGIITDVKWDAKTKSLVLALATNLNSFDVGGTHDAIDKHKVNIKKKYPGIKNIHVGTTTIHLT